MLPVLRTFLYLMSFALIWWVFWYLSALYIAHHDDVSGAAWYEGRYALPLAAVLFFHLSVRSRVLNRLGTMTRALAAATICLSLSPAWLLLIYVVAGVLETLI